MIIGLSKKEVSKIIDINLFNGVYCEFEEDTNSDIVEKVEKVVNDYFSNLESEVLEQLKKDDDYLHSDENLTDYFELNECYFFKNGVKYNKKEY